MFDVNTKVDYLECRWPLTSQMYNLITQQLSCFLWSQSSEHDLSGKPFYNAFHATFAYLVFLGQISHDVPELLALAPHFQVFLKHLDVFSVVELDVMF